MILADKQSSLCAFSLCPSAGLETEYGRAEKSSGETGSKENISDIIKPKNHVPISFAKKSAATPHTENLSQTLVHQAST